MTIFSQVVRNSNCISKYSTKAKSSKLKVLFFGTDDFSAYTLRALHREYTLENGCISHLETCTSKMKKLVPAVKLTSDKLHIKSHPWPPDLQVCRQFDIGIVSSFGHLIPSKIIQSFPRGMLNVHGSLLPKYRGAAPIPYAILNGDKSTGLTIMEIEPFHFDIGKILATEKCNIDPHETRQDLSKKMGAIGAELMIKVLQDLDHHMEHKIDQPSDGISYAPKIVKTDFEIKWAEKSAQDIYNQYRALSDMNKLYSFWKGTIVKFEKPLPLASLEHLKLEEKYPNYVPGQVISVKEGKSWTVCIKCLEGWIAFERFYYDKRKVMNATDFYSGFMSNNKTQRHIFSIKS